MPGAVTAFQTGVHGSRPAASAGCIHYSCTTHSLIYQSDGASWTTYATLTGSGYSPGGTDVAVADGGTGSSTAGGAATNLGLGTGDSPQFTAVNVGHASDSTITRVSAGVLAVEGTNISLSGHTHAGGTSPGWVGDFVGTTDSTHFYWDGNDLASFTTQTVTGSATWSEGTNLASVLLTNQTADDVAAQLIAQSFSTGDAWTVPVRVPIGSSASTTGANRSVGIIFADGTTTSSNCVAGHIQIQNGTGAQLLMVGRHGTLTAISTAPWVSMDNYQGTGWVYIKLIYQASNTFRLQFSPDGVTYSAFGESDISKTMTPTHVGIVGWCSDANTFAIGTFGPLKKV